MSFTKVTCITLNDCWSIENQQSYWCRTATCGWNANEQNEQVSLTAWVLCHWLNGEHVLSCESLTKVSFTSCFCLWIILRLSCRVSFLRIRNTSMYPGISQNNIESFPCWAMHWQVLLLDQGYALRLTSAVYLSEILTILFWTRPIKNCTCYWKHTQFKTRVQQLYQTYDQNGQNRYPILIWPKRLKNHTLCSRTYLFSPCKGVPPPPTPTGLYRAY